MPLGWMACSSYDQLEGEGKKSRTVYCVRMHVRHLLHKAELKYQGSRVGFERWFHCFFKVATKVGGPFFEGFGVSFHDIDTYEVFLFFEGFMGGSQNTTL